VPLIVADPRAIELTEYAAVHLQQAGGTDVALINAMMHVIVSEGLADEAFIAERTEGFDDLRRAVEPYTPELGEKITGVPAGDIARAARLYARAPAASIVYSMGITQHTTGTDNVLSLANLAMLTGNVGKPGSGVNPLRGQNNVQGACDLGGLPNVYPGYQVVTDLAIQDKFERAWGVEGLSDQVGLTVTAMIDGACRGSTRVLFVLGENPMLSDPDINHVRQCLNDLPFLVVQDIFLTETAELADVVLPATSFAEKDGTFTGTDRRIQRVRRAIEPVGESRADWEILCQLARRMDAHGFDFQSPGEVMDEIAALTPIYGGVSYKRLAEGGSLQWPVPTADHPGTPYLHKGRFSRGQGRFHAIEFQEAVELPDDEYPFTLTTGRMMFHWHTGTMTRRSEKLEREAPSPYVELHPEDAARIGLNGAKRVRVASRRGEIELGVRITPRIRPGVVFIPFHYAEAAANVLTNAALDPIAKIPEYKVCAVKVQPVD
jgi:formate dehydrogenase alpha subunit